MNAEPKLAMTVMADSLTAAIKLSFDKKPLSLAARECLKEFKEHGFKYDMGDRIWTADKEKVTCFEDKVCALEHRKPTNNL